MQMVLRPFGMIKWDQLPPIDLTWDQLPPIDRYLHQYQYHHCPSPHPTQATSIGSRNPNTSVLMLHAHFHPIQRTLHLLIPTPASFAIHTNDFPGNQS